LPEIPSIPRPEFPSLPEIPKLPEIPEIQFPNILPILDVDSNSDTESDEFGPGITPVDRSNTGQQEPSLESIESPQTTTQATVVSKSPPGTQPQSPKTSTNEANVDPYHAASATAFSDDEAHVETPESYDDQPITFYVITSDLGRVVDYAPNPSADVFVNLAIVSKYTIDHNHHVERSQGWERQTRTSAEVLAVLPDTVMLIEQRCRADKRCPNADDGWVPGQSSRLDVTDMSARTANMIIDAHMYLNELSPYQTWTKVEKNIVFVDYYYDPTTPENKRSWSDNYLPRAINTNVREELGTALSARYDASDYVGIVLDKRTQVGAPWFGKNRVAFRQDRRLNAVYTTKFTFYGGQQYHCGDNSAYCQVYDPKTFKKDPGLGLLALGGTVHSVGKVERNSQLPRNNMWYRTNQNHRKHQLETQANLPSDERRAYHLGYHGKRPEPFEVWSP
jgi:hypothetical protein